MTPTLQPSGTVSDLGRGVKAKYPGQYDDVHDDDLGRALQSKYPGQYDDFVDATPDAPPTPQPSAVSRFSSSLAQTTGIPQMIDAAKTQPPPPQSIWGAVKQGASDAVTNSPPAMAYRLAKSILQQQGQQFGKAYDVLTKGDYPNQSTGSRLSEAAGYTGAGLLPVVGPMAAKAGEQIGSGDVAGGLGTATGALLATVAPDIAAGASKAGRAVAGAFDVDPTVAMVKALRPVASNEGFTERLPDTLANIKAAAAPGKVTGNAPLIAATKKAIDNHQNALEQWMAPARQIGTTVPGDPIVQATADALPDSLQLEDPQAAQSIIDQAQAAYGGKTFDVDTMRNLLKEKNAELNAFYSRAEGKQAAAVTSGKPEAVVKAQRDAIAESLYQALDPSNGGAGPRQIQSQTGDMIDILDAANRSKNRIIAEKPLSRAGMVGNVAARVVDLPGKVLHGNIEGGLSGIPDAVSGTSDPLIHRAFKAVGPPAPIPLPGGTLPARTFANPVPYSQPQLASAPMVTPPPAVPNPVTVTTGPQLTGRQIAPPVPKMPSVPDVSGASITTGTPLRASLSRQISAGPSVRTLGDAGSGQAGDLTTDLVPVYDAAGNVSYYGKPQKGPFEMPPAKTQAAALADDVLMATKPVPPKKHTKMPAPGSPR